MLAEQIVSKITGKVNWWYPIGSVLLAQTGLFVFCQFKKDNSYIDIMWSLTFIIPNAVILGSQYALGIPINTRVLVTNACVLMWGLRLAAHIGIRHTEEDYRYQAMRKRFMERGQVCYYLSAYFYIFIMQSVLSLIVNSATLF